MSNELLHVHQHPQEYFQVLDLDARSHTYEDVKQQIQSRQYKT